MVQFATLYTAAVGKNLRGSEGKHITKLLAPARGEKTIPQSAEAA